MEEGVSGRARSLWKAVGLSLLLPGAGEFYLGLPRSGAPLALADGIAWSCAAGFAVWASWREDEYKTFAAEYAGVDIEGKDDKFFRTIALYQSRDDYNYYTLLAERSRGNLYPETDEWYWRWRSEDDMVRYYDIWSSSRRSWRNFKVALGIAALNRIISVINVVRLWRGGAGRWSMYVAPMPSPKGDAGVTIGVNARF